MFLVDRTHKGTRVSSRETESTSFLVWAFQQVPWNGVVACEGLFCLLIEELDE